jgi:hypothetical protein
MIRILAFLAVMLWNASVQAAPVANPPVLTFAAARAKLIAEGYKQLPWRNRNLASCSGKGGDRSCIFAFERKSDNTQKAIETLGEGALNSRRAWIIDEGHLAIRYNQPPSGLGTYPQARARLIAEGYQPLKFPHGELEYPCNGICDRYPELEDCSGTGMGYCTFVFFRPSDGLRRHIITAGEDPIAERSVDDIVGPFRGMKKEYQERLRRRYYPSVRSALIRQGYKPLTLKETDYKSCPDRICERYAETLACQGMSGDPCQFVFYRASDRTYRVVTAQKLDADVRRRIWDLVVTGSAKPTFTQLKDIEQRR